MDLDVWITVVGLSVAGLAAVLGIWVERDARKPPRYAYALSVLILLATIVGMYQVYADAKQAERLQADMARMLQMLDKIAGSSDAENPELQAFVKAEIATQSRANPEVVTKLVQRVADEGGDPGEMLSKHLPASEVEGMQRKGNLTVKPTAANAVGGAKPTIAIGPKGDGAGEEKKPLSLIRKKDDAEAPADKADTEGAAAAPDSAEPRDLPAITPKVGLDLKAPKLGGAAAPEGGAVKGLPLGGAKADPASADAAKADAAKPAAPKLAPKPKL